MKKDYFKNYVGELRLNIPISLMKDSDLKIIDIVVYGIIDHLSFKKGYAWISNKSLSDMLDVSAKTIQTSINRLVNKQYLIKTKLICESVERRRLTPTKTLVNINLDKQREERENLQEKNIELFSYNWIEDREEED